MHVRQRDVASQEQHKFEEFQRKLAEQQRIFQLIANLLKKKEELQRQVLENLGGS